MSNPPNSAPSSSLRSRRWYRFGLAGLLLLILAVGAGTFWRFSQIQPERAALITIRDAKGSPLNSWEYRFIREPDQGMDEANRPAARNIQVEPVWPRWLREALGNEFFARTTALSLPRQGAAKLITAVTDLPELELLHIPASSELHGQLGPLQTLPALQGVYVEGAGMTATDLADLAEIPNLRLLAVGPEGGDGPLKDEAINALSKATQLESFRLSHQPAVSDAAMAALVARWPALTEFAWFDVGHPIPQTIRALADHHPDLQRLALSDVTFTDSDLAPWEQRSGLVVLRLDGTGLTDAALVNVANHQQLVSLFVPDLAVKGTGLQTLKGLNKLRVLNLERSQLSESSLSHLPRLPLLTELDLSRVRVPVAGLQPLAAWTQLETLNLSGSNLTNEGLQLLAPLKATLQSLEVANTEVTEEASVAFRAGAPPSFHLVSRRPGGVGGPQ